MAFAEKSVVALVPLIWAKMMEQMLPGGFIGMEVALKEFLRESDEARNKFGRFQHSFNEIIKG